MDVTVSSNEFLKTLNLVCRVVAPRPNLPVLSNLLLVATKAGLEVSATNLETSVKMFLPAKVVVEGRTTAPAKVMLDFVASSRDDKLKLQLNKENLEIIGNETKASLGTISALEFPPLPTPVGEKQIRLEAEEVTNALSQVVFAASVDEGRPVLTGVLLRGGGKNLTLVATDGYRLAKKTTASQIGIDDLIVPARSLSEVAKLISDTDSSKVSLETVGGNQVIFSAEHFEISSRVLEGAFPNFEQIIPKKFICEAAVKKEDLATAIRQVATLSRDLGNVIQIETKPPGELLFSAKTAQLGHAESKLAGVVKGAQLKIAFNAKYVLDGLNAIGVDEILIKFSGATSPATVLGKAEDSLVYIVMPVRIQS